MKSSQGWKGKAARFLTAQTLSLFGSSLVQYAIVWSITLSTGSGALMTLATVCGFAPQILISLFAGVWADRYNRKWLIILSDSAIALATLLLALFYLAGIRALWMLYAALLLRSAGAGVQTPAVNALIPQIVPEDQLMRVNGVYSAFSSLTTLLSPAVSGALLSFLSLEAIFFVDVITAFAGVLLTLAVAVPPHAQRDSASSLKQIAQGFAYLKANTFVRRLLLFQIAVLFLINPSAFLTPLMVSRSFGPEVWRLTVSEMSYSAGAALGGLLIASWGGFHNRMKTTLLAGGAYGVLMLALGSSPYYPLYLCFNLLIGITAPCYNAPIAVSIQEKVDPAFHGRVFSLMQISTACALPLGMLLFGPLADHVSVQALLRAAGLLVLLSCVLTACASRKAPQP